MKLLIASIFALTLMGTLGANAEVGAGVGVHVGNVGIGADARVGDRNDHPRRHHRRHCTSWRWQHHHRECRHWRW